MNGVFPGVNPRQMQQMMKQMGVQQVDVDATRVIIETPEKRIVIEKPQVARVTMMGQQTWQVSGVAHDEAIDTTPDISADDVETVVTQTGCSREDARKAIADAKGDLAEAILKLSE